MQQCGKVSLWLRAGSVSVEPNRIRGWLCPSFAGHAPEGFQLPLAVEEEGAEAGEHVAAIRLLLEGVEGGQRGLAGGAGGLEDAVWEQQLQEAVHPPGQVGAAQLHLCQCVQQWGADRLQVRLLLGNMSQVGHELLEPHMNAHQALRPVLTRHCRLRDTLRLRLAD